MLTMKSWRNGGGDDGGDGDHLCRQAAAGRGPSASEADP